MNDKNTDPGHENTLKELLQKRQELDREVESRYTKSITLMFTDIQGSTEFYDTHGDIDGRLVLEKHNQILASTLEQYKGRIIKSTGDGMMVVFDQPEDSVRAAVIMQKKLRELNEVNREKDHINVRIAINHGKALEDEGDVYGLEVSVAARINSVTKAGQILISESLYEKVKNTAGALCRPIPPVSVKGVKKPLQLYEAIWNAKDRPDSNAQDLHSGEAPKKVFVLEITKEAEKIKISGHERSNAEQKTVRYYEEVRVDDEKIARYNADIISILNNASKKGYISKAFLQKLETAGQLLYDEIFSLDLKRKLASTEAEDMIINIDDNLVSIPWELLHNGNSFFCLRFNMGRLVRTRQSISAPSTRMVSPPLKMLIISDPQGNLGSAYKEGYSIRDELVKKEDIFKVNIRSSSINASYFMEEVRNFDILHYAGHADYDRRNPSDSGFLMKDRKIKASDIISMIGTRPMPSLVFSNACQSGHTEKWTIGSDYGNEIYGLANAFLLAGVRHYIGTFWNVQDEPGQHFAMDFYREIMNGAMIGKAMRTARLRLIERYGEDAVIWASYMLYGDPTFKYIDVPVSAEKHPDADARTENEEKYAAGNVRAIEDVVVFPPKKQKWMATAAALILALIAVTLFMTRPEKTLIIRENAPAAVHETAEARQKRIDALVASMISSYNKGQQTVNTAAPDIWKTGLPTLAFLNIRSAGVPEEDRDYIMSRVTDILQGSNRVQMVEREIIDKLLEELKLSSSSLADPATALKIGRILSARLMATGSIVRDGTDWQLSFRLIETETTSIKAALTSALETRKKEAVAEALGMEILERIKAVYPVKGNIVSIENNSVVLDAGYRDGASKGMKMHVLSGEKDVRPGEIEITEVEEDTSTARIISQEGGIRNGLKVKESL